MNQRRLISHFHPRISILATCSALLSLLLLSGCLSATPTVTPGPLQTATATPRPTATATPLPPGTAGNPLVVGLVQVSANLDAPAESLSARLASVSGLAVAARVFSGYDTLFAALGDGDVHIAFLPPLTYLYASQRGLVEAALLSNHFGVFEYGSQFMANAGEGFTIYYDPLSGQNSADAATALAQFAGKRPCWVDPGSAAGYVVPAGVLIENKIEIAAPAFSQSHAAVIRSLYVKGVCDFGASFSYTGDPRTAASVLDDLPDAMERIPIIWRSDPVIPNLNVSYLAGLQDETRNALNSAFLLLAADSEGRAVLSAAAGDYDIEALKVIDDSRYAALRGYTKALDLNLSDLLGK